MTSLAQACPDPRAVRLVTEEWSARRFPRFMLSIAGSATVLRPGG